MNPKIATKPTVTVTGAAGFLGSRIVKLLQNEYPSWNIQAVDNFYAGDVNEIGDVTVESVDVRDRKQLETTLEGTDIVIHLAAISGVDDCKRNSDLAHDVNVTGTSNVVWFCRKTGAALVFPLSMAVLGNPREFPITVDQPRAPLNWYGRTKMVGERLIESMATDEFPAHLFMKSNLYGEHEINSETVTKNTVINFFVNRALDDKPLTVYEPGTQSRNYIHIEDVAWAYIRSAERLCEQLSSGSTGVEKYEIASDEDLSVMGVAEMVKRVTLEEVGRDVDIKVVENPRENETFVGEFPVDTERTQRNLGWSTERTVEETIRNLIDVNDSIQSLSQ